jgi:hypothetical protein
MVELYVASLTKASMQGSSDVKDRVRDALGIANSVVKRQRIGRLDGFFTARNAIVHDLDYQEPSSRRTARHSRRIEDVRDQCKSGEAPRVPSVVPSARRLDHCDRVAAARCRWRRAVEFAVRGCRSGRLPFVLVVTRVPSMLGSDHDDRGAAERVEDW